jgi:hypothetical protein
VTSSNPGVTGSFSYARSSGSWTWSDEMFSLYGFAPGDVVPTTELVLSHQHPEDRDEVQHLLLDALEAGRPLTLWHRVVDAEGSTRHVVTVVAPDVEADGGGAVTRGVVVDVTESLRRTTAGEVDEAMAMMAQSRPAIEQAKGALMHIYGVGDEEAFVMLRRYSQLVNVKLRDVARNIVEALADRDLPLGTRPTWDEIAAELSGPDSEQRQQNPGA